MIAKYLFFLILFMVILIHALEPRSRLGAAALFMSKGDHGTWLCPCVCVYVHKCVFTCSPGANIPEKMKAPRIEDTLFSLILISG